MAYFAAQPHSVDVSSVVAPSSVLQKPNMVFNQQPVYVQAVAPSTVGHQMPGQPQTVTVLSTPRPAVQAMSVQNTNLAKQPPVPGQAAVRVMQMAGNVQSVQLPPHQSIMIQPAAPIQQQAPAANDQNVVYVNVNGALQRAVLHNGLVYLLNGGSTPTVLQGQMQVQGQLQGFAPQQQQLQQSVAVAVPASQPANFMQAPNGTAPTLYRPQQQPVAGGVQPVLVQQVVSGAGTRLVPGAQGTAVSVGMAPQQQMVLQQPQPQLVQQQQQISRPMMTVAVPSMGGPPMMTVMPQAAATAGAATVLQSGGGPLVQPNAPLVLTTANTAAGSVTGLTAARVPGMQPVPGAVPMQQLIPRGPAARPMNFQGQIQPNVMRHPQQQQQWRPSAGVGTMLVNTSVPAGAAGQGNAVLTQPAALGPQIAPGSAAMSASGPALVSQALPVGAAINQQQQAQQMLLVLPVSSACAGPGVQSSIAPANAPPTSGGVTVAVPLAPGGVASPPVPPTTPSMMAGSVAPLADSATGSLALMPNGTVAGGQLPMGCSADYNSINNGNFPACIVNNQCPSKDSGDVGRPPVAALSSNATASPPACSAVGSQPGTPARSYGFSSLQPGDVSSTTSEAMEAGRGDNAAVASASGDKAVVMRLLARSFIETGIALEQALTMIQPADRDLLAAAFGMEAKEQSVEEPTAPAAAEGVISSTQLSGLRDLGGVQVSMPQQINKPLVLSSSLGPSLLQDDSITNSSTMSLGSWGFSLFSGGDAQSALNAFDALSHTGRDNGAAKGLGSDAAVFTQTSAAVTALATGTSSPGKEFAMTSSMLAALNL